MAITKLSTAMFQCDPRFEGAQSVGISQGTTAERDVSPIDGLLRYNTTQCSLETYYDDNWVRIANRLDSALNETNVSCMEYNSSDLMEKVCYETGNMQCLCYDINDNLSIVDYYATNGSTKLFAQCLIYNVDDQLICTTWTKQ
tara:strand:+ start:591 stop:1019 length:429 start_codon:yes stop_codon:yes gene_type:complete